MCSLFAFARDVALAWRSADCVLEARLIESSWTTDQSVCRSNSVHISDKLVYYAPCRVDLGISQFEYPSVDWAALSNIAHLRLSSDSDWSWNSNLKDLINGVNLAWEWSLTPLKINLATLAWGLILGCNSRKSRERGSRWHLHAKRFSRLWRIAS